MAFNFLRVPTGSLAIKSLTVYSWSPKGKEVLENDTTQLLGIKASAANALLCFKNVFLFI